ncbi:MAG: Zn-binding domain-containing protein, partial [Spirochaetota bacterium]
PVRINTYDGDTPASIRVAARDSGRIIISNPDMLHTGVLPNHPKWIKFLSALAFVVIDEIHMYRGVFGSHMTNLIRRLKRIAAFYGTHPRFICCSATIGNPLELATKIIETDGILVDQNGAPSGEKNIILYNPPILDAVQGIRRGVVLEARRLAIKFLKRGIKTIVFARSRIRTELIASYIRESLKNMYSGNHRIRVESYRGGYLPNERRAIEKGLRDGTIQGVVSTNALELGVDIGGLDTSILAGLPGSIASSWQQAGRAGRRNSLSLAVMIASASPTDQYIIAHPEYFFSKSPESGLVDPDNIFILTDHLKCAVFELPIKEGDDFGGSVDEILAHLEENGVIRHAGDSWYWSDRSYPAEQISLRSASQENVVIINTSSGKYEVIGEMDRPSAKEMVFDNAVYIHRGDQYQVKKLDIEDKKCYVEESDLNYYTDSIAKTDIKVLHEDREYRTLGCSVHIGDVLVRTQVTKFKKIKFETHESIGYGDIFLPEEEMHTRSLVIVLEKESSAGAIFSEYSEWRKEQIIARIGNLFINVAPVFLLCDIRDIRTAERLKDPHFNNPALYFYDAYPGGTGLAEGFFDNLEKILKAAYELVARCPCLRGCPSCIGPEDRKPPLTLPGEEPENPKSTLISFLARWITAIAE